MKGIIIFFVAVFLYAPLPGCVRGCREILMPIFLQGRGCPFPKVAQAVLTKASDVLSKVAIHVE